MLLDLIRALGAAVVAVVLPGYFWAVFLRPTCGLAERLGYSIALSLASVPVVALILAHIARSGISLWIAIASAGIVLASGMLAVIGKGAATGPAGPILARPQAVQDTRALVLLAVAFVAALIAVLQAGRTPVWLILVILALLVLAAVVDRTTAPDAADTAPDPGGPPASPERPGPRPPGVAPRVAALRASALAVVLAATAVRAYGPVIRYDWPSIRGLDHYSHAVMAEQMLAHGSYQTYLVYPPGFSTVSAVLCRLSGLSPLALFPVLAPALLVITALAAYALATRLWGWGYGIAAAALAGLVLHGAYGGLADGRYPDLLSAYFLVTMGVAALLALYQAPTARSALLAAVLGASPVLYHSVATLYEGLILVLAAVTAVPYLLYRRHRADARVVLLALAGLALLSACYAWYTYGVGWPLVHHSASSDAVSLVLGSQQVPGASHLLVELAPPIIWLGVLGLALLAMTLLAMARRHQDNSAPQVLAVVTLLLWCLLMYLGSRTAADGFPQRFERDIGAPLSVVGALSLGLILKSFWLAWQRTRLTPVAAGSLAVAVPAVLVLGVQAVRGANAETHSARLLSAPVVAAGDWLRRHNSGGTIVSTSMNDGITERSVLALGGYPGLQWYTSASLAHPRSLPPAGLKPLIDAREVLEHPGSCRAARAIATEDVRYVVLYRGDSADFDLASFRANRAMYRKVFANPSVIIYAPRPRPARAGGARSGGQDSMASAGCMAY
jgi:hypothetical protein